MKKVLLQSIFFFILIITTSYAEIVKEVKIVGNVRVSSETILIFGDIRVNEDYNVQKINELTRQLYDTDFFSFLEINLTNGLLEISVKENPIIQSLVFNGIKAKKHKEAIRDVIQLKEKTSYVENKLIKDIQKIKKAFRKIGFYFIEVEAYTKENTNNSIDLIYEINRGKRAKIGKIVFIGDKKVKDSKLRGIITSEENKVWKFISTKKYLNQGRIKLDTRLLENFYKGKGYYQVKVLATNILYEEGEGFLLTYNIDSGKRFRFENVSFKISEGLDKSSFVEIEKGFPKLKNKYYSPKKIIKILDKINKLTTKKDLQFINSKLIETVKNDKILVTIEVSEGKKYFVERINIIGKTVTEDNVIRGELEVDEGDPYSLLLLDKSINNIKSRNIFGKVNKNIYEGSSPDLKVITIEVEERATGEIFAGAGVGSSGGTIGGGVKENNFLGRGVKLDANLQVSETAIRGKFSVVNPNYNYSGNEIRFTAQSTKTSKMTTFGYDSTKTGFSLGTTFEQYEDIFISPDLATYYESLSTDDNASKALKQQEGTYIDTELSYSIIQDKRDQSFKPTEGYRASFNQKLPLYSESPSILNGIDYSAYHSFSDSLIGSLRFHGRSINSLSSSEDVKLSERLSIPGRYLRGFEVGKIGPVDALDYIGGNFVTALGFNASLPKLLPNLTNADVSLFLDTGNVWGIDYDTNIDESNKLRSAFGVTVDWFTPMGPLSFSFSEAITSASTDKLESFRFNIGTTF
jgi:outer membrane protein insertion porin family